MKYKAKELCFDWHSKCDPSLTAEKNEFRIGAINLHLENEEKYFWLDVVRLHFGINVKNAENLAKFVQKFKDSDGTFPLTENEAIVKSLASISLCFLLEDDASSLKDIISLAILNTNFFEQYSVEKTIPVKQIAFDYITGSSLNDRNFDDEDFDEIDGIENLETARTLSPDEQTATIKALKSSTQAIKSLSEETNILWWIFGEYSKLLNKPFTELGSDTMVYIGAKELSDLLRFQTGIVNSKFLLAKCLNISNKGKSLKNTSLLSVLRVLTEDQKKTILSNKEFLSETVPCLLALNKSMEHDNEEDWSGTFKRIVNGGDIKKEVSPIELSAQIFNEYVYVKLIEE